MLASKEKMVAYPFEGYWKDVGTIDSLWEANMDLLNPKVPLDVWSDELEDLLPQLRHAPPVGGRKRQDG